MTSDKFPIRTAWKEDRAALGAFLFTRLDPVVIEAIGQMSYDYVCIDMQHGLMDQLEMTAAIRALQPGAATAVVRVPSLDRGFIGRALDTGAMAVIIPGIESAEQAREAVRACRYVPEGERSYGPISALVRWGREYAETANERVLVIPMIETKSGVDHAEEICAVEGVDGVYVGPFDLSISMGLPLPPHKEALDETLKFIVECCRKNGIAAGIHGTTENASYYRELGFRMITLTTDFDVLTQGFNCVLEKSGVEVTQEDSLY